MIEGHVGPLGREKFQVNRVRGSPNFENCHFLAKIHPALAFMCPTYYAALGISDSVLH